ncbi:MAG: hypothetical protein LBL92_07080 [Propionibacteriaceae bacterium]|jgi:uncharacterized protein YqeY|nr:hypothetical protein [Propionibacteriaceae bacterium]
MTDAVLVLTSRLRAELTRAAKARKVADIAALRSLLSALDNAGAQPAEEPATVTEGPIAYAVEFGQAEVARRVVSVAEAGQIVAAEIAQRRQQSQLLDQAGRDVEAAVARSQAKLLARIAVDCDFSEVL